MKSSRRYTLTLSCPDSVGIVAAVSNFFAQHGGWIVEASYHADTVSRKLFMRQEVLAGSLVFDIMVLKEKFAELAGTFSMHWQLNDSAQKFFVFSHTSSTS